MKITDVHLTLFAWDDIPATQYGRHTGTFSGASQLGLLTIETDDGVRGHAFLGSAMRGAHMDGQSLVQYLKPLVVGQDPLARERLYQAMWHKNRQTTYRAIGAMDVALWDIAGKAAGLPIHRLLGSYRELADPTVRVGIARTARACRRMPARPSCRPRRPTRRRQRASNPMAGRPTRSTLPPIPSSTLKCAVPSGAPWAIASR